MSTLRYTDTLQGKQFHDNADEFASEILRRAIVFASEVPLPDSAAMRPNSNTLVSKHVEAQLEYMRNKNYLFDNSWPKLAERTTEALETLANAHAEDGVRVHVSQPWHSK
tara:strand:+ start:1366 stop:1695 length:330 start_codon:yes stop_codon:yes gene_type:complete